MTTAVTLAPSRPAEAAVRDAGLPWTSALTGLGDPHARLLAGPRSEHGPEPLGAHVRRLGDLPFRERADHVRALEEAGVLGRGGGEFPLARKLSAAAAAGGPALVVANGAEGEPASRKDRLLLEHRPHLVLDGLEVVARAAGATRGLVYLHAERQRSRDVLRWAIAQRRAAKTSFTVDLATVRGGFVAGESSSVVSSLEDGPPRPRRTSTPAAVRGVRGHPTIVSNVETLAHVGLLARFGPDWFRQCGSAAAPGSSLLTLAGAVRVPGAVVEVMAPVPVSDVLALGGVASPPQAVLVGGYGGTWLSGAAAWGAPVDRGLLRSAGVGLGCGVVAPIPPGTCGLAVTATLLAYLARQSAGQCGTCVHGLPAMADALQALVAGDGTRADARRLAAAGRAIRGGGGCAHPDGAVSLLESALFVFSDDLRRHARGRSCGGEHMPGSGWFPVDPPPVPEPQG